jgi:hypothetical protein
VNEKNSFFGRLNLPACRTKISEYVCLGRVGKNGMTQSIDMREWKHEFSDVIEMENSDG